MRLRFIKPQRKERFVLRGPFTEDSLNISHVLIEMGYKPAGVLGYWIHVIVWRRKKRESEKVTKTVLSK